MPNDQLKWACPREFSPTRKYLIDNRTNPSHVRNYNGWGGNFFSKASPDRSRVMAAVGWKIVGRSICLLSGHLLTARFRDTTVDLRVRKFHTRKFIPESSSSAIRLTQIAYYIYIICGTKKYVVLTSYTPTKPLKRIEGK